MKIRVYDDFLKKAAAHEPRETPEPVPTRTPECLSILAMHKLASRPLEELPAHCHTCPHCRRMHTLAARVAGEEREQRQEAERWLERLGDLRERLLAALAAEGARMRELVERARAHDAIAIQELYRSRGVRMAVGTLPIARPKVVAADTTNLPRKLAEPLRIPLEDGKTEIVARDQTDQLFWLARAATDAPGPGVLVRLMHVGKSSRGWSQFLCFELIEERELVAGFRLEQPLDPRVEHGFFVDEVAADTLTAEHLPLLRESYRAAASTHGSRRAWWEWADFAQHVVEDPEVLALIEEILDHQPTPQ